MLSQKHIDGWVRSSEAAEKQCMRGGGGGGGGARQREAARHQLNWKQCPKIMYIPDF